LAHYAHHVGQIVLLGKTFRGQQWQSLSIPRGGSAVFNAQMLAVFDIQAPLEQV
jgi:hypothetical protein